jgi:hypothetical protein
MCIHSITVDPLREVPWLSVNIEEVSPLLRTRAKMVRRSISREFSHAHGGVPRGMCCQSMTPILVCLLRKQLKVSQNVQYRINVGQLGPQEVFPNRYMLMVR